MKASPINALTAVTVICAFASTAVLLKREFTPARAGAQERVDRAIPGWRDIASSGHRIGPESAPVVITEFADFECPACRAVAGTLREAVSRHPGRVALVVRHFPMSYHRFARGAAAASACAAEQGHFAEYYDILYATQDSLGLIPFAALAVRVGLTDTVKLAVCMNDSTTLERIDTDLRVAKALNLPGTPSVIVNGTLLGVPPTAAALDKRIKEELRRLE